MGMMYLDGVNLFVLLFSTWSVLYEKMVGRSVGRNRKRGGTSTMPRGWLSERISGESTDAWIYMTLPPTLTPQPGSAYIIVYLIPRMVLKIPRTTAWQQRFVSSICVQLRITVGPTTLCRQSTYYTFGLGFN